MKAGSKSRAEQTEGVLSRAEMKRMAGMKERRRPGKEDRNEHLVGGSKDGSFEKYICKPSELLLALEQTAWEISQD